MSVQVVWKLILTPMKCQQYERTNVHYAQKGRGLLWGGVYPYPEASAYGVVHFARKVRPLVVVVGGVHDSSSIMVQKSIVGILPHDGREASSFLLNGGYVLV